MSGRRRIVTEVVLESSLFQGHLRALALVRRLIDASLVPRTEGYLGNLIARLDLLRRYLADVMAAQGAIVLLALRVAVSLQIRSCILFLFLQLIEVVVRSRVPLVEGHSVQALIPLDHPCLARCRLALPTRHGRSVVVRLRQLALDALELPWLNPDGAQHVCLRRLLRQAVLDLLFHLLRQVLLHLLQL